MTPQMRDRISDLKATDPKIVRNLIPSQSSALLIAWYPLEERVAIKTAIGKAIKATGLEVPAADAPAPKPKAKPAPKALATTPTAVPPLEDPTTEAAERKLVSAAEETGNPDLVAAVERTVEAVAVERAAKPKAAPKPSPKAAPKVAPKPAPAAKATPKPAPAAKATPKPKPPPAPPAPPKRPRETAPRFTPAEINKVLVEFADEEGNCVCTACKQIKPLIEGFGIRRMNPTTIRRQAQCRECRNKAARRSAGPAPVKGKATRLLSAKPTPKAPAATEAPAPAKGPTPKPKPKAK